jgi:two-component system chemotaxis sensor kinase CheA
VEQLTKEFLVESQEGLDRMESCLTELELHPDDGELVSEIFRTVHTIKGTTGFLGFTRTQALAHAGENLLGALRDKRLKVNSRLIDGLLKLMDGLRAILTLIAATGTEGARSEDDDSELIAHLAQLKTGDSKLAKVSKSPPKTSAMEQPLPPPLKGALADTKAVEETISVTATSGSGALLSEPSVRVDVEVLNQMMNQVGELVLTRNQILRSAPGAKNFSELARRLDSVTVELRETVMRARMQPVGHLFSKFPRMVRDLGVTCGRRVRLEFEGSETGLDKSLLEAIRDPLTHTVRNAVDHGIEPPSERVRVGKPVEGVVRMRAFHHCGAVIIEVIDDGAGISTEVVLAKAIERGLVTPEEAATMSQRDVLQLLFVAGFSTAKEITCISGRGVGLDVVRNNMERVGGRVELESRVGSGTTVRMRVPLTLAIVPALVVYSGGASFALPQSTLAELVYVPEHEAEQVVERIGTTEVFRLRERLLPLVWLDRLLGLKQIPHVDGVGFYIAVMESEGCRFGLAVNDLKAPEEIVVKPLSEELREIGIYSGATVLGDGTLALILDVAAVGARAGVRPVAEDDAKTDELAKATPSNASQIRLDNSMVIYEIAKHGVAEGENVERMAMPLSAVERIESVPLDQIEYASGRPVLQYCGDLIPLVDEGGVLRELRANAETAASNRLDSEKIARASGREIAHSRGAMATVLICMRPEARGLRRVGMVVRRVLDVSAGTLLDKNAAACPEQLAMVKKRVTMVHDEFSRQAALAPMENLREVA